MQEAFHSDGREGQSMKDDSLTPLGLPREALGPVMISYIKAKAQHMNEDLGDPMKAWFGQAHDEIEMNDSFRRMMQVKIGEQVIRENNGGLRMDRMKKNSDSMRQEYWRKVWILESWVSFHTIHDEITDHHLSEIGLAYLTDETASAVIEYMFPESGEFTTKQFRDFRERYELVQVPLAHRHRGVMVNGELKITHVGRKSV
jgi:hypothetical protein